jgi:choline-sulfatase
MTLTLLLALACTGDSKPADAPKQPEAADPVVEKKASGPNVVLVTMDTTRYDRIGAYGYDKARTDTIDALAARGQRFDYAYSPIPLTIPSHASMFTGLELYHHGVRNNGSAVLEERFDTLAEILKGEGYATAGSVAAYVTTDQWGLSQGFDAFFDDVQDENSEAESAGNHWHIERPAEEVMDDAVGWLESDARPRDRSFFLWTHLYDPHHPLQAPEAYTGEGIDPYDAEIAYMDDQIGRLQAAVEAQGVGDNTLYVLVADHGEGLGGHLELTHGLFLYNGTQRVPWIMAGPGIEPGVVDQTVGIVDLTPTVLTALGIPVPEGLDGAPQPGNEHPVYLETYQLQERFSYSPHIALVDGTLKLIDTPQPELYDQRADPRELTNLAPEQPETVAALREKLEALGATPPGKGTDMDAETRARLEALGYISSEVDLSSRAGLPDPKDKLPMLKLMQQAQRMASAGAIQEAIDRLEQVTAAEPSLIEPRLRVARLYVKQGKPELAVKFIEEAIALEPDNVGTLTQAIVAHGRIGNYERSLELCEQVLALKPDSDEAAEFKMTSLDRMGRSSEAIAEGEAYLADRPDAHNVAGALGVLYAVTNELEKAEPLLRRGTQARQPPRHVHHYLGVLAAGAGQPSDAIQLLTVELKEYPDNRAARLFLIRALSKEKRYPEVRPHVELLLKRTPEDMQLLLTAAQVEFNQENWEACAAELDKVKLLDPEEPEYLLLRANLLAKTGKADEAKAVFEQAKASKARREADKAPAPSAPAPAPE